MKKIIKLCVNFVFAILNFFCKSMEDSIVVGGWFGKRFADNSKAMYLYLANNKEQLGIKRVVYATRSRQIYKELCDKGYDVVKINTWKSYYVHMKAKYHIIDDAPADIQAECSIGKVRVNLWHGFPLKMIINYTLPYVKCLDDSIKAAKRNVKLGKWNNAYNLVLSDKQLEIHRYAFGLSETHMIKGVYPRVAYLQGTIEKFLLSSEKDCYKKIEKIRKKGDFIVGYFPTFRDDEKKNVNCYEDIINVSERLQKENIYIVTKMHFAAGVPCKDVQLSNLINLPPEADVYNFISDIDVLITDYSSIYFDFLLLNKPIIFYCFDLDYYNCMDRGFLFDYEMMTPGVKVYEQKVLVDKLLEVKANPMQFLYEKKRKQVIDIVYDGKEKVSKSDMQLLWENIHKLTTLD